MFDMARAIGDLALLTCMVAMYRHCHQYLLRLPFLLLPLLLLLLLLLLLMYASICYAGLATWQPNTHAISCRKALLSARLARQEPSHDQFILCSRLH